jgi:hypothetical protein
LQKDTIRRRETLALEQRSRDHVQRMCGRVSVIDTNGAICNKQARRPVIS